MPDTPSRGHSSRIIPPKPQAEVDAELAFHLEQRIRDYVARGMDPAAARAAALERLGDLSEVRTECVQLLAADRRDAARRDWLDDLRQDLRFGVRSAMRAPLFTMMAVFTLALGVGANAAVFGVVKSVLLDALPYPDADRLVRVYGRLLDGSSERGPMSAGTIADIVDRQRSFERLGAFGSGTDDAVFSGTDAPIVIKRQYLEPSVLQTLGVPMAMGRAFRDEDAQSDTARVVMLTYPAWQRLFAGDPAVVGREIRINGISRTVIGVLPRRFVGPVGEADFYFPLGIRSLLRDPISARGSHWMGVVGRLKPGVTVEAADRELASIAAALAREYPKENGYVGVYGVPLRRAMVGDTRTPLLVLMASAGLVLVITCANLAGALLSRTLTRRKEFAVRIALGAGRGRLIRQLLTESTVLALAGGAAGILLAMLGLAVLRGLALPALPPYAELKLDPGALVFTGLLALLTGLAFGIVPALAVRRTNPQGTLRDESRGASESRGSRHLRGALVAGQIALCVSLLAGAGLLARSLWSMTTSPLGFHPAGVLTVNLQPPAAKYPTSEARARVYDQFAERLSGLPGVSAVAHASGAPTLVLSSAGMTAIEGQPPPPSDAVPFVLLASVSDDYFRTLGIPLRRGRTFGPEDVADAPPRIVISEGMARRYWPKGDALGARIRLGPDLASPFITVVGIVGDVRNDPARPDPEPIAYMPSRQNAWPAATFLIRTEGDPLSLVKAIERDRTAFDPAIPLHRAATLESLLADGLSGRRLPVVLMTAFGGLALLLASVGVYAMFASMAAAREREFGVRVALGSSRGAIAGLVLRQGAFWMIIGLAGGAFGVVLVSRSLRGLLYGVAQYDPIALGIAVATLVGCATVALLVPVRRATRVDPITVLR